MLRKKSCSPGHKGFSRLASLNPGGAGTDICKGRKHRGYPGMAISFGKAI
jgi:hypothetical protein